MDRKRQVLSSFTKAGPSIRSPHDAVAFMLHCSIITSGFASLPESKNPPSNWNATEGFYGFRYRHASGEWPVVSVKAISMENTLLVHACKESKGSKVTSLEVRPQDFVVQNQTSVEKMFEDPAGLIDLFDAKIISAISPPKKKQRVELSRGPLRRPPRPAPYRGYRDPPYGPGGLGSHDLDPFGIGGGGNLLGPRSFPGVRGPRFDPFGPGNPDANHLPPPGSGSVFHPPGLGRGDGNARFPGPNGPRDPRFFPGPRG